MYNQNHQNAPERMALRTKPEVTRKGIEANVFQLEIFDQGLRHYIARLIRRRVSKDVLGQFLEGHVKLPSDRVEEVMLEAEELEIRSRSPEVAAPFNERKRGSQETIRPGDFLGEVVLREWDRVLNLAAPFGVPVMGLLRQKPGEWLIKDVLVERTLNVLVGATGIGKTYLLLQMLLDASAGRRFLGLFDVPRPVSVCLIEAESDDRLSLRLEGLLRKNEYDLDAPPNVPWFVDTMPWDISDPEEVDRLAQSVKLRVCDLLVVDTFNQCNRKGSENDDAAMRAVSQLSQQLIRKAGTAVLIVHHSPLKDAARSRGIQPIVNDSAAELVVKMEPGGFRSFFNNKPRHGKFSAVYFDTESAPSQLHRSIHPPNTPFDTVWVKVLGEADVLKRNSELTLMADAALKALRDAKRPLSTPELKAAISFPKAGNRAIWRSLIDKLKHAELVSESGKGRGMKWGITPRGHEACKAATFGDAVPENVAA
jgi:hypothetical protein